MVFKSPKTQNSSVVLLRGRDKLPGHPDKGNTVISILWIVILSTKNWCIYCVYIYIQYMCVCPVLVNCIQKQVSITDVDVLEQEPDTAELLGCYAEITSENAHKAKSVSVRHGSQTKTLRDACRGADSIRLRLVCPWTT